MAICATAVAGVENGKDDDVTSELLSSLAVGEGAPPIRSRKCHMSSNSVARRPPLSSANRMGPAVGRQPSSSATSTAKNESVTTAPKAAAASAAQRGRAGARQWRGSSTGIDAIRAKVKAEMKAESLASKQRAQVKIDEIEEKYRKEEEETTDLQAEAKAAYALAIAEERRAAAEARRAEVRHSADASNEQTDEAAEEEASEPSHLERIQELLKDRSERLKTDSSAVVSLRERLASRRLDSDRFGERPAAAAASSKPSTEAVVNRSLFHWAPPSATAPPVDAAAAAAKATGGSEPSAAGRAAWEWLNRAPALRAEKSIQEEEGEP